MQSVFNNNVVPKMATAVHDLTDLQLLGKQDVGHSEASTVAETSLGPTPAYLGAVRSLRDVEYMDNKRAQLSLAASRWLDILSVDWRCSQTGQQISDDLQSDRSGDLAEQTLKSVFGVKSPATILKRAASVQQYVTWHQRGCIRNDQYTKPFPFYEEDVWRYFLHLRSLSRVNKKGFTVSSTFLETVRFCKFVIGFYNWDEVLQ